MSDERMRTCWVMDADLFERLRNIAWAKGSAVSHLAEVGVTLVVEQLERANGGRYPPRPRQDLRTRTLDELHELGINP